MKNKNEKNTWFLDLDGSVWRYCSGYEKMVSGEMILLPGVKQKLQQWRANGDKIIITTARDEVDRVSTTKQLQDCGIEYDLLLMSDHITSGRRLVVNDKKTYMKTTAVGITLERDEGFERIDEKMIEGDDYISDGDGL